MKKIDSSAEAILPEIVGVQKMSTAWCALAFEDITDMMTILEAGTSQMTPVQRRVWERYKEQTRQFAHDMLLAEGHPQEILRRLNLDSSS